MLIILLILFTAPLWVTPCTVEQVRNQNNIDLKAVVAEKLKQKNEEIKAFRSEHGSTKVGDVTVDMMYGGMRGTQALVTETSLLDEDEGIRFRGYSIPECRKLLPKASNGNEFLPEGMFWLLITGDIPTPEQVKWVSKTWAERAALPSHVVTMLQNLPNTVHPMTQLVSAVALLSSESKFVKAYSEELDKSTYWEYVYEDSMDLIAKLPVIAATIYRNVYFSGQIVGSISDQRDWSANFGSLLGIDLSEEFNDLIRLYLTIHADHGGGNVSAHTIHLVGSALSDPYLSFSAGMAGLAGPLHGLANQEALEWLKKVIKDVGIDVNDDTLKAYVQDELDKGQIIPGYGHCVLRTTDPRFTYLREFASRHLPNDPMFKLITQLSEIVPPLLQSLGKVKNPWPNVDAHSGVLLQHYKITQTHFYTVLFGVSRALGTLASLVWDRGLGLPIERPKSMSTEKLKELVNEFSANEK